MSGVMLFRLVEFYIHTVVLEVNPVVPVQSVACRYEKYAVSFVHSKKLLILPLAKACNSNVHHPAYRY